MQPATLDEPRRTHSQLLNTTREEHHNNMHSLHKTRFTATNIQNK